MIFVRKAHVMECSVKLSAGILLLRELTDEVGAALHRLIFFDKKKKKKNLDVTKATTFGPKRGFSKIYF